MQHIALISIFISTIISTIVFGYYYLKILDRFNIRRPIKQELANLVPGHKLKLGTLIMGGVIILFPLLLIDIFVLGKWDYSLVTALVLLYGAFIGFVDEYMNTLNRTFKLMRSIGSQDNLFQIKTRYGLAIKKFFIYPWQLFEELLRISGSTQGKLSSAKKITMHFSMVLLILLLLHFTVGIDTSLQLYPYQFTYELGYLYYIFIFIVFIFFETAFGITDGVDGLSASLHTITFSALLIISYISGESSLSIFLVGLISAELVFLMYNRFPAKVEMSDVGTFPLGILFVLIAIILKIELLLFLIGLIYVVEILSSFGQQWSVKLFNKRILSVAPIHHHFEKKGWGATKVVIYFSIFTLLTSALGVILYINV